MIIFEVSETIFWVQCTYMQARKIRAENDLLILSQSMAKEGVKILVGAALARIEMIYCGELR